MKRLVFVFVLMVFPATIESQTITVLYRQTIQIPARDIVAAFSLDDYYAEAKVQDEMLVILGRNPGRVRIVEVGPSRSTSLEVIILPGPLSYPPGFVPPLSAAAASESSSYESRYTSYPAQSQNTVDLMRREGDRAVQFHVSAATFFSGETGLSPFALSSVFYQVLTPHRDIVLLDQLMTNSPLTVDGSVVRGFHFRQGGFVFHAGYASLTSFENFFLPSRKEGVFGVSYRFPLGEHAVLMPNLYYFPTRQDLANAGQPGPVASLVYDYQRSNSLSLLAETGFSHGMGAAARLSYTGARQQWNASMRYEPLKFASLSLNSLHGLYSNVDWTRYFGARLTTTTSFTGDHYTLPTLDLINVVANLNVQYQVLRNWYLISGVNYGNSKSRVPVGPQITTFGLPAGVSFYSGPFQGSVLYQYARNSGAVLRSDEFRASAGMHWREFRLSGFVDRQTQAPTISFILAAVPGLQEALDTLAISATTPDQIALALRETAGLANQGFIEGVNIDLSPVRLRSGSELTWSNHSATRQQVRLSFLYNRDNLIQVENRTEIGTAAYSLKFKNSAEVSASLSLFRSDAGASGNWRNSPLLQISVRRHFGSTPNFIIPRRRGMIAGIVFVDDGATGAYRAGGRILSGVEVVLDDTRKTHTDNGGHYTFPGVAYGPHMVEAIYRSAAPFFFTTPSRVQSEVNSEINFGVGLAMGRIFGTVHDENGKGLPGVEVEISNGTGNFRARTDDNGKFHSEGLSEDQYEVRVDVETVPPGYSLVQLQRVRALLKASAPFEAAFAVKAIRTISGRVTICHGGSKQDEPAVGVSVVLVGRAKASITDENGTYMFRELPAGRYTLEASSGEWTVRRDGTLPNSPVFLNNIDLHLGSN